MAKLNGPLGSKLRGKVGEVVAAKTVGGDTALRAYQPVVKNPNTLRQQAARNKFAALSSIVARLAEPLAIGYAKANEGAKMYVRNTVLSTLYGLDGVFTFENNELTSIDWQSFPFSRKVGIEGTPLLSYTAPQGDTPGKITVNNASNVTINEATEELGVVVVAVAVAGDTDFALSMLLTGKATAGIEVTEEQAAFLSGCKLFAFFKAMPKTGTDIPTEQWPWKYPSNTGASVLALTIQ